MGSPLLVIKLLTIKGNFATLSAMTRQWRIEFEGRPITSPFARGQVLSRGNERRNIFNDNQEIGNLFGLGYSSISRRVTIPRQKLSRTCMKSKMSGEDEINKRLEIIKSLIKVWLHLDHS